MSNRAHYVGFINGRRYDIMATEQEAPGVMFARAMAAGQALAIADPKTNQLSSGVFGKVGWPVRSRG